MNSDTVKLLKVCNVGCKYASNGMEQVLPFVKNEHQKTAIERSNQRHGVIGDECNALLRENGKTEAELAGLTLLVSRVKRDVRLCFSSSPKTIAALMIEGCETGIDVMCKALKNFPAADKSSVELVKNVIDTEQEFLKEMIEYY